MCIKTLLKNVRVALKNRRMYGNVIKFYFSIRNMFFKDCVHIPRVLLQHGLIRIYFVDVVRCNGLNDQKT